MRRLLEDIPHLKRQKSGLSDVSNFAGAAPRPRDVVSDYPSDAWSGLADSEVGGP